MDQSTSNSSITAVLGGKEGGIEFFVGLFMLIGMAAVGYLAVGLGGLELFGSSDKYDLVAEFDNIAGLQNGASVEIAGVQIGAVVDIDFVDPQARVHMKIDKSIQIRDDDIALIRTKGIIGDRYVKISRGASDIMIPSGGVITETESVVDFEDIVGKIVHRMGGKDE